MNLLFLVEGEKTEPKVYRAWLKHLFPDLIFVNRAEDTADCVKMTDEFFVGT